MSCNVSKRLNKITSSTGKTLISGDFKVSNNMTNAKKDMINTIKYEKNLLPRFLDVVIFF